MGQEDGLMGARGMTPCLSDVNALILRASRSYLFWIIVAGLAFRVLIGIFFTYPYDSGNWAKIAETVVSGGTLYERPDNYYAPLWGYILTFLAQVYLLFGGRSFAYQYDEYLFLDSFPIDYFGSVIIEPGFVLLIKVLLIAVDLAVAFVIRRIALEMGGSESIANAAFALWFLCPITIYSSASYVIFDTIEVLFLSLCLLSMIRGHVFIAGFMMLMAGMIKPFAFYVAPLFLAHILLSKSEIRERFNCVGMCVGGFASAFLLLFFPVMIGGEFSDSMSFLTGRVESAGDVVLSGFDYIFSTIVALSSQVFVWLQPILIAVVLLVSWMYFRTHNQDLNRLILYSAIIMATIFVWPVNQPCYYLVLILFLALLMVGWGRKTPVALMLLVSIPSILFLAFSHNYSLLMPFATYSDLLSTEWVLDHILSFNLLPDWGDGTMQMSVCKMLKVVLAGVMLFLIAVLYKIRGMRKNEASL